MEDASAALISRMTLSAANSIADLLAARAKSGRKDLSSLMRAIRLDWYSAMSVCSMAEGPLVVVQLQVVGDDSVSDSAPGVVISAFKPRLFIILLK